MKNQLLLIIILFSVLRLIGQVSDFPKGLYSSFKELRDKQPSLQHEVTIKKREIGEILMLGGNDYIIFSNDGSIKNKVLKKQILAYSNGDSLFINCLMFDFQLWYALALKSYKNNIFILAAGNCNPNPIAIAGGAINGAINATKRCLFVLDLRSGYYQRMSVTKMNSLIADNTFLKEKYNLETEKDSDETFLRYINQL